MSKLRGGSPAPQAAVSGPEADKIRGQLKEMSQKIGELEKEGKHDEAARLKNEARTLYGKLNPRANAAGMPAGPQRDQLRQQMQAIHEKIEKAKQAGNADEVQRLQREAEALRARLYPQYPGGPQASGDRQGRLQHLRAAAENLKAAGFEPEAQHVMQMISRHGGKGSRETVRRAGRRGAPLAIATMRQCRTAEPDGADAPRTSRTPRRN